MSRFAQGKFNLKNPEKYVGRKTPTYRSSWEFAFMQFCDNHPNVAQWASEAIRIPYKNPFTGKHTIYVPDFFVQYVDKNGKTRVELIEVKPANQTHRDKLGKSAANQASYVLNQAKWAAASAYCKQQGIFFRVVNETDIFHQGAKR
jgi:hypothetical protein|tara:strand:+ start:567 stop:1004 length:438 start_codon:yes stop_codon:yes gene_type:complete